MLPQDDEDEQTHVLDSGRRFTEGPYKTPLKGLYLCSASTPPGGGVHGMCGHNAAKAALRDVPA